MERSVDVVVVGAGLGGLATGALAARAGLSCEIVERARDVGGRGASVVRDGYVMNLGGHALYRGGAAERVLTGLDVALAGRPPPTDAGVAMVDGTRHKLPTGPASLLTTRLLGPREKLEFGALLHRLPRLPLDALEDVPFAVWLEQNVKSPRVRSVVETLVRLSTYAHAPELLSAGAGFRQLRQAASAGVMHLDHGWQVLVDALVRAARDAGVTVHTGSPALSVAPDGGAWHVTLADGSERVAGSVVLATGPRAAAKMVRGPAHAKLEAWSEACVPGLAACLDVALRSLTDPKTTFALGVDEPLYFSVHSSVAALAPPGGALVHVMRYLHPREHSADAFDRDLESWLDVCQPGWRDAVVSKRYLPAMVATNDIARAASNGLRGRPGPSVPDADGLYVVGDWVGAEGMLADASLASAELAARYVVERRWAARPTLKATG